MTGSGYTIDLAETESVADSMTSMGSYPDAAISNCTSIDKLPAPAAGEGIGTQLSSFQTAWNALGDAFVQAHQQLDSGTYHDGINITQAAGRSAQILGLLNQSDINGFGDGVKAAQEAAERNKQLFDDLTSFVPVPEIPGASALEQHAFESATDIVKGMAGDSLFSAPPDSAIGDHIDNVQAAGQAQLGNLSRSLITTMSSQGLPVITHFGDHGQSLGTIATVGAHDDPGHDFTDMQGHLRPFESLSPGGQRDYIDWARNQAFFGSTSTGSTEALNDVFSSYGRGAKAAVQ